MSEVITSINIDTLVKPVPTIAVATIRIFTKNIFIKVFRLWIGFRSINVDTEVGTVFLSFLNKSLKVFNTTDTFTDVCIVQVSRVMSFTSVSLKKYTLTKTICMEVNLLDTIQGHEEWVLRL